MIELIKYLEDNNIKVSLKGDDIQVSYDGKLNDEVINKLKNNKQDLISFLQKYSKVDHAIKKVNFQESYPISNAQKRIWVTSQVEENSKAYHIHDRVRLNAEYHVENFEIAIKKVVKRHEILRTVFKLDENTQIRQWVLDENELRPSISYVDFRSTKNVDAEVEQYVLEDNEMVFDLENGPLFRCAFLRITDEEFVFYYNMHHIITDGWSLKVLEDDFSYFYNTLKSNEEDVLEPLRIQYKDYVAWQMTAIENDSYSGHKNYWIEKLSGELPKIDLPGIKNRPKVKTYNAAVSSAFFNPELTKKIRNYCNRNGGTLFVGLTSILKILFHKYTGEKTIVLGTSVAGRENSDLENQIGFYVNTIPLRTDLDKKKNFSSYFASETKAVLEAFSHQIYPFDIMVDDLNLTADVGRNHIFDIMVNLYNHVENDNEKSIINKENYDKIFVEKSRKSNYDLEVIFEEIGNVLGFSFVYNTEIYDHNIMERMINHFKSIAYDVFENPEIIIEDINYITQQEQNLILNDFNNTDHAYPEGKTVVDIIEDQVKKNPNNVALVFEDTSFTYLELNDRANQLSNRLVKEYNIQANDLVGVKLFRSAEMVISILAILKSGGAYVPIDPNYPQGRIDYILKDGNIKLCIDSGFMENFNLNRDKYSKRNSNLKNHTNNLAYCIYTSGSTGNPKGVLNHHAGLFNRLMWMKEYFSFDDQEVFLQKTPFTFDVSVWELILPFMTGSKLVVARKEGHKDVAYLDSLIEKEKVTVMHFVPSMLTIFLQTAQYEKCSSLSKIICSGEALPVFTAQQCKDIHPGIQLYNLYGPTEAAIDVTAINVSEVDVLSQGVSIGKPIANTKIYIVNNNFELQPIGVKGELIISGIQVARGYLNLPELTNEKFIKDPFREGFFAYKTGDIAAWNTDGSIKYIGRSDNQVKIRGNRIEIGEIENRLSEIAGVIQSVVLVKEEDGVKFLVAYFIGEKEIDKSTLKSELSKVVPDYMVPNYYVQLDSIPLSANGKASRKLLPPVTKADLIKTEFISPSTKEEKILSAVWSEVLKYDNIGLNDNFYNLGGDSIKSILVVSRLKQEGYKLKVEQLLSSPNLGDLAKMLEINTTVADQSEVVGDVVLTPIQQYFFENQLIPNKNHFNQTVVLKSNQELDVERLKNCISKLVEHHDALRMSFVKKDGIWIQNNNDSKGSHFKFDFFDIREASDELEEMNRIGEEIQASFDIGSGVLFKALLFRLSDGDRIAFIIHHLVVDGVSWRILIEDISNLYLNYDSGVLPLKTDSFQSWATIQQEYAQSEAMKKERMYWESVLDTPILDFPVDSKTDNSGWDLNKSCDFLLSKEMTEKLKTQVHKVYNTEINDILLTCLGLALRDTFGISKSMVLMEGHGREEIVEGLDTGRTIGWFTSMYPFVLEVSETEGHELVNVKESLRKIPNKGIGYGILNYLDTKFESESQPGIMFNYLGDFGGKSAQGDIEEAFELSAESVGNTSSRANNRSQLFLDVSGIMISEGLSISVRFSDECFKPETINSLIEAYHTNLENLISELSNSQIQELTPSDLTYKGLPYSKLLEINSERNIEDIYELSPLQQGMYFQWLVDKTSENYFEQFSYNIQSKNLDIRLLEESFNKLIERYPILRTSFNDDLSENPLQVVYKNVKGHFSYEKLAGDGDVEVALDKIKKEDRKNGFSLSTPNLMRLKVVETQNDEYVFLWSHHHILMDGWCVSILINDFYRIMVALGKNEKIDLPEPVKFSSFIKWLSKIDIDSTLSYWKEYLAGFETITEVPFKKEKSQNQEKQTLFQTENLLIEKDLFDETDELVKEVGVTWNTFLQGVWGYLLSAYNNTSEAVFGSIVSGRPPELSRVEQIVGLFANSIPVRVKFKEQDTPRTFLLRLQNDILKSMPHHYASLSDVQAQSDLGMGLIDNFMVFQNYLEQEKIGADEIAQGNEIQEMLLGETDVFEQTNYDFGIEVKPSESSVKIGFRYNTDVYEKEMIENLVAHFSKIIENFKTAIDAPIKSVDFLTEDEKQKLLVNFNDTLVKYPKEKTIVDLFEEQVSKTPDRTALTFSQKSYTYLELNDRANELANFLIENHEISVEDFIAIKLEKSEWLIISILAILKTGAAYVPIDLDYPEQRVDFITKDTNCNIIIDSAFIEAFSNSIKDSVIKTKPDLTSNNLAYVMYTSGSTGVPKGVLIEHKNVVRLVKSSKFYQFKETDVLLSTGALSFDATTLEYWGPLLNGGCLVMCPKVVLLDTNLLEKEIVNRNVNVMWFTAGWFNQLIDSDIDVFKNLKTVFAGGERLSPIHINKLRARFKDLEIINGYGPTENTTFSLTFNIKESFNDIPIGFPISNSSAYILDNDQNLQPLGVVGEIYLGGDGVARGYLNAPELTAEKFIPSPFNAEELLYKTGDLGKFNLDGSVSFMGRKDNQVKISGYRIEVGEVETCLSNMDIIDESVVTVKQEEGGNKYLVAYFVSEHVLDKAKIKTELNELLPYYMVPSHFMQLEYIPLTANGKVDRKALPDVSVELVDDDYVAPGNDLEKAIAAIWQEVLKLEKVGVTNNFFELGGHSLSLITVVNQMNKQLSKNILVSDFFKNPTIEGVIKMATKEAYIPIPQAKEMESYPLTSSQKRLWVLSQFDDASLAYKISSAIGLQGSLDIEKLQESFRRLISRHEILRTYYKSSDDDEVHQYIIPEEKIKFSLSLEDFTLTKNQKEVLKEYFQSENLKVFNLDEAPQLRGNLIKTGEDNYILYTTMHHILADGWSVELIATELMAIYNSLIHDEEPVLVDLPIQYKDYAVWMNTKEQLEKHKASEKYWLNQFSGDIPVLEIPASNSRPKVKTFNGDLFEYTFSDEFQDKVNKFSANNEVSLFMVLLAGVNAVLSRYSGQDDIIIGTPIAGRYHADLENSIGLYLNTLALRTKLDWEESFTRLVGRVKNMVLDGFENQSFPFDELVSKLRLGRDTSRSALFDVMMVLQSQTKLERFRASDHVTKDIKIREFSVGRSVSKFDLNFEFIEGKKLRLATIFNTDLFDRSFIKKLTNHFETLMLKMINQPHVQIKELSFVSQEEKNKTLVEFNKTSSSSSSNEKTVVDLFESQVEKEPENIALVFDEKELTYKGLNERANQFARFLQENYQLDSNALVAIKTKKTEEVIVAILGILKSGCAYLPIDPNYPLERIRYIEQDSNCGVVIDEQVLQDFTSKRSKYASYNIPSISNPDHLAYAIYTSGSTGNPKGVMIEHAALKNYLTWAKDYYSSNGAQDLDFGLFTSLSFDLTVTSLFLPLINGNTLTVFDDTEDVSKLLSDYLESGASCIKMTPTHVSILERLDFEKVNIDLAIVGGESLLNSHIEILQRLNPQIKIFNEYGPTESTVGCIVYEVKNAEEPVLIGKPIANTQVYILDRFMHPCTIGDFGELYIAGDGLARGYLNREDLTKARFVSNPFKEGTLMYKTGDLCKWLPDGNIEYIGRSDNQVKIRGHRIELGEIENVLSNFSKNIKQVFVEVKDAFNEKKLVAYFVADSDIQKTELKDYLSEKLPKYMLPDFYIKLESIPLTTNGKVNRRALPDISGEDVIYKEYIAPRNQVESKLVDIWKEVLGVQKIGVLDSFFDLGGNSLTLFQLSNRIKREFCISFDVKNLFNLDTLEEFSDLISMINSEKIEEIPSNEYDELTI